jgi:hypothetical protein
LAAGILQSVHFTMEYGAAFLHTAVMPAANDLFAVHDHRSNRDAAFREPLPGFLDRGLKKYLSGIHR